MNILETDPITTADLTSSTLVGSYTASAATIVAPQLMLNGLDTAGNATVVLRVVHNDGTNDHPASQGAVAKHAAADSRLSASLQPVPMASGDILKVYAESTNTSDTSVSGSVRFWNVTPAAPGDEMEVVDTEIMAIATTARDQILDRVLSGNHDTAGTPGKLLQDVADSTGGSVDGVSRADFEASLLAFVAGEVVVVNNGDGTKRIDYLKQDDATVLVRLTVDAAGQVTAKELNPA